MLITRLFLLFALAITLTVAGGTSATAAGGPPKCGDHSGRAEPGSDGVGICLPDEASDAARDAIDSNPGKAINPIELPEQLRDTGLLDLNGIENGPELVSDANSEGHRIRLIGVFFVLGFLQNDGSGNFYVDTGDTLLPAPLRVQFVNRSNTEDLVISQSDDLTLRLNDGRVVPLILNAPITVHSNDTPDVFFNFSNYWIDVDGRLYVNEIRRNEVTKGPITYEDAVALGPQ